MDRTTDRSRDRSNNYWIVLQKATEISVLYVLDRTTDGYTIRQESRQKVDR
jgi:hypothetical protein